MVIGYLATLVCILLALAGITLEKAYFYLPLKELNRRATKGDHVAANLSALARYGDELRLVLDVTAWLGAAIGIALLVRLSPLPVGFIGAVAVLVSVFFWQARSPLTAYGAKFAAACAGPLQPVLKRLHPTLNRPAKLFLHFRLQRRHTGLYELSDFIELADRQRHQRDNRVDPADLDRLTHVLRTSERTVGELMTPREHVTLVRTEDTLSPVTINELHESGQRLFPVYRKSRSEIVGVLAIDDVADIKQHGRVEDVMADPAELNAEDSLEVAIRAFYASHQTVFIVVDGKDKFAGVLTLDALFGYLLGDLGKTVAKD